MAAGSWVRSLHSLHCKSTAASDVAATVTAVPKKPHPLLPSSSCASSGDAHKNAPSKPNQKPKPGARPRPRPRPKPTSIPPSSPPAGRPFGPLPALTELPAGHSSRQVVEIIFLSSWSPPPQQPVASSDGSAFTGGVEMLFRVHNPARAVARFEDYRAAVRARAGGASRSAADGNEMMRFSPVLTYSSAAAGEDLIRFRTFDGSGRAHANGSGPASGRLAMLLCRVIAGRVADGSGSESGPGKEYDSVRVGKGELVVFDRRALLPCFLIIYRL